LQGGFKKSSESIGSSGVEKMEGDVSLLTSRSIPLQMRGSVYESCVRSVMLYGVETWALTGKLEYILKTCDCRILRYMVRGRDLQ